MNGGFADCLTKILICHERRQWAVHTDDAMIGWNIVNGSSEPKVTDAALRRNGRSACSADNFHCEQGLSLRFLFGLVCIASQNSWQFVLCVMKERFDSR